MKKFKNRWEITKNWQLIHPFLGVLAALISGYIIARPITSKFTSYGTITYGVVVTILAIAFAYFFIRFSLWCFKKLKNKWKVTYRWEYIAIFLCFAATGSTAGKLSTPIMELIGLGKETTSVWLYWPVRIVLIFPLYQVLLIIFGWIFGQYSFFKGFIIKMLSRMGLSFIFGNVNG